MGIANFAPSERLSSRHIRPHNSTEKCFTFSEIWNLPQTWVEPVNTRNGGWSGVSRHEVIIAGKRRQIYLKRQKGQFRRSARSLLISRPTYWFEMKAIEYLRNRTPLPVEMLAYGEDDVLRGKKAFLVTASLEGYTPLDELIARSQRDHDISHYLRLAFSSISELHRLGIAHGALFANHIFINRDNDDVKLIDFERCRRRVSPEDAAKYDFSKFFRRDYGLSEEHKKVIVKASLLN